VEQVRLNPVVDQNVVTYAAIIAVPNSELKLKPGMTATATIEIERRNNVLRIPNAALRYRPAGEPKGGGPEAWVASSGAPVRVALKTGLSDGTYTEALSGGIAEGALVITGKQAVPGQEQTRTGAVPGNPFAATQQGPQRFPRD
jgi:HlyD family secretion protein